MLEVVAVAAINGVDGERSVQLVTSTLQHEGQLSCIAGKIGEGKIGEWIDLARR